MKMPVPSHNEILKMMRAILIRQYRLDLKIPSVKLSKELPFHNSKLCQLERAYYPLKQEDAQIILEHYGVDYKDFSKEAERLVIELSSEIVNCRLTIPWFNLYQCTEKIFKLYLDNQKKGKLTITA